MTFSARMRYKALGQHTPVGKIAKKAVYFSAILPTGTDLASSVCTLALRLCISPYGCAKIYYPLTLLYTGFWDFVPPKGAFFARGP